MAFRRQRQFVPSANLCYVLHFMYESETDKNLQLTGMLKNIDNFTGHNLYYL